MPESAWGFVWGFALEDRQDVEAIEGETGWAFDFTDTEEGGQPVGEVDEVFDFAASFETVGPAYDHWNADAAFVDGSFGSVETAIVAGRYCRRARFDLIGAMVECRAVWIAVGEGYILHGF